MKRGRCVHPRSNATWSQDSRVVGKALHDVVVVIRDPQLRIHSFKSHLNGLKFRQARCDESYWKKILYFSKLHSEAT